MTDRERITYIMNTFNFQKVHRVMIFLEWTWSNGQIPSIEDLRECAKDLLTRLEVAPSIHSLGTGGFYARRSRFESILSLEFALEDV